MKYRTRYILLAAIAACLVHLEPAEAQPADRTLPTLTIAPLSDASAKPVALSKVRKLNSSARKALRSGQYQMAIDDSIAAITLDPSNMAARYRLSNAYALAGEPELGFAVLAQFQNAQESCVACVDRMARARLDHDWGAYHKNPRFIAVTESSVTLASVEQAAVSVANGIVSGKGDAFAGLVHPRKSIKISVAVWACVHDDCGMEHVADRNVRGQRGLDKIATKMRRAKIKVSDLEGCKEEEGRTHCRFKEIPETLAISSMVFKKSGGGVSFLSAVNIITEIDEPMAAALLK